MEIHFKISKGLADEQMRHLCYDFIVFGPFNKKTNAEFRPRTVCAKDEQIPVYS
jgi:hypothetical protein